MTSLFAILELYDLYLIVSI